MKAAAWVAVLAGLAVCAGLVAHAGAPDILRALAQAGWPLLWLLPAHALPLLLDAQGWRVLLGPSDAARRAPLRFLFWVAAVREAVSRLLPSLSIGGEVVGIRLVAARVPDAPAVAATVIAEVLLTMVAQYLFCALGIVLVAWSGFGSDFRSVSGAGVSAITAGGHPMLGLALGLLLSLPVPLGLAWVLRDGAAFERLAGLAQRLLGSLGSDRALPFDGARIDAAVRALLRQRWRLARALAWQCGGYLLGSFEAWLALRLVHRPVTAGTAVALEALLQATRHVMFMVPAGLGAQEAAMLLLAGFAGVGPQSALLLALLRRAREVLFGVPALLSWQWREVWRLRWAARRPQRSGGAPDVAGPPSGTRVEVAVGVPARHRDRSGT